MAEERILIARFANPEGARKAVERLNDEDYPLDRLSLLGHAGAPGDDPLGIYYHSAGEQARGWGKMGAFWGAIWGLLTGAAGMFLVPGLGPIVAAGPIVESLVGAAGGAVAAGGAMAGAGALTHLAHALRHTGVPDAEIDRLHEAIEHGEYVLLMRCTGDECERCRRPVETAYPEEVAVYPFR